MDIYVDIDNTICKIDGTEYVQAVPIMRNIERINDLFDKGHIITYWTARGMKTGLNHRELTEFQLEAWGCKYHHLYLNKPPFDLFIDDKCVNSFDFFKIDDETL